MIIYDKNGNTRCTVKAFEYHDVFMGECYLSIDIDSPEPISFAVGDYCIFRGEYFYLNYVPSAEKTASKDSRGDAFKYSAMKLDSSLDELTRCLFLDIVPSSYNVTFTGLPDFTFYAQTAQNLADRIQANLDSLYGTGVWTINVITSNLVDYNQVLCSVSGNKPIDASMSISGKTCMEALAEFYNTFKLTYIVRGRTITVAPTGTAVGATFGYGKGNGLSGLKQQTKTDSLLITRLYCYGSTRNIGTKYYANLTGKAYSSIKTDAVKYETVAFQFSGTATNTDIITITLGGTAFHVDMSSYTGTGLIQGTLFADYIASKTFSGWTSSHSNGTNIVTFTANDSGIKPDSSFGANPNTMTAEITVAQKGLSPYQQVTSVTPNYFYILLVISKNSSYYKEKVTYNGESVYKVKLKCGNYEVGGYISLNVTEATVAKVYPTETNYSNFISQVNNSSTIYITDGVWLDLMSSEFVEYDNIFSANLAVTHLMLPDFPFVKSNPNDVFIDSNNKNTLGIRQGQVYFDGSDSSHPEVYPTIHEMTAKEVIDSGISLSLDSAEGTDMSAIRLDEIKDCDNPTDNGYISTTTDNTQNPTIFTIYLKDVGFDLTFLSGSELYYASGGKLTIRMLSGSCSGREFTVNGAKIEKDYTKGYLRYKIVCDRYQDQALNKQFPYSDYKINAGDTFVLLNCRLPNVYVAAASQKLLNYGNAFLSKNDSTKYTYIPQLDEIWMANHPDIANSIKTGDLFDFSDTDLNISEKVFIKTLNIKVGDKLIPTYDLTLDDTIESSTIQKIQNQINNISVGSFTQTNIVNNFDVIKSTDVSPILSDTNIPSSLYVDDNYISSKKDDTAEGHITFNNGITTKGVSTIDEADIHILKADSAEIEGNLTVKGTSAFQGAMTGLSAEFSGLMKAAAATVVGLMTVGSLSANSGTVDNFNSDIINVSTKVTSPLFVGALQGNADTATKLQTARSIWGQSFDGSGNVSGLFTNGYINIGYGNEIFTDNSPLYINYSSRGGQNVLICTGQGGVGIGLMSPAYKLHVNGDFGAATAHFSNLSNGYIPYNTSNGLTNSPIQSDGTKVGIGMSPTYGLDVAGTFRATADMFADGNIGTRNYVSQTTGWRADNAGNSDFRKIYADELNVQAFTAQVSQALAGSDFLTKSVSKLSYNFVIPSSVGSTARLIVDDLEGFPATQCFVNGDYIRLRPINKTGGLIVGNAYGTVTLDTTYGTNGFLNGTQAYAFTTTSISNGAGLTVYKGSEVLDYGTSGNGLIKRTVLDSAGSPYMDIDTWSSDPSNPTNYATHVRLGNLAGVTNCSGYGLYSDNVFLTKSIVIGDLTKSGNYLSFDTTNGLQIKLGGNSVATTADVSSSASSTLYTANINAQGYASSAQSAAISTAASDATTKANNAVASAKGYTDTQISVVNGNITSAISSVQIGGTNLLLNSGIYADKTDYAAFSGKLSQDWEVGKTYTISIKSSSNNNGFAIFRDEGYTFLGNINDNGSITFVCPEKSASSGADNKTITLYYKGGSWGGTYSYHIDVIKVESGTKATDWSPAPEDVTNAISTAQSNAIAQSGTNAAALYVTQTNYNSYVSQTDQAIAARVTTSTFNALGGRVDTAESNISANANAITQKVSTTDYNGNTIASLINQSATTVKIQASQIYLDGAVTFSSLDSSTQGVINAKADISTVNQQVSNAISTAATDATNKVNAVQVGGTNLLIGSSFQYLNPPSNANFSIAQVNNIVSYEYTANGYHYTALADNGAVNSSMGILINSFNFGINVGDTICFSADVKGTFGTSNSGLCVMHATTDNSAFYAVVSPSTPHAATISNWTRKSRTYVIPSNIRIESDGSFNLWLFWGGGTGSSVNVYTRNTEIELGNKPSSTWSPAPEDVDSSISTAQQAAQTYATANCVQVGLSNAPDAIKNQVLAAAHGNFSYIDGSSIYTGTLNANQVTAGYISADRIAAYSITTDKLATNVLAVGNISGLGDLATQSSIAYDSSYLTNKPTSLSAINSTEGTKLGGIAAGATVGATWGTNISGIPSNLAALSGGEAINNATAQDNLATQLGYTNYADLVAKAASSSYGSLTVNGYFRTSLIQSEAILTNMLAANCVTAAKIDVASLTAAIVTATSVNAVAINGSSITAGTIDTNRLDAATIKSDIVNAAYISSLAITTGTLTVTGGSMLGALSVQTDGSLVNGSAFSLSSAGKLTCSNVDLTGKITATSGTLQNVTISGTLNAVTGTFSSLSPIGGSGSLVFGTYGLTCTDMDYSQQGTVNVTQSGTTYQRTLRYYTSNVRCRGAFGASSSNFMVVYNSIIYYYVNGNYYYENNISDYVQGTATTSSYNGHTYYNLYLYPTASSLNNITNHGSASSNDLYGFPVDVIIIESDNAAYYRLIGDPQKKVTIINANDGNNSIYFASCENAAHPLQGGNVMDLINVNPSFMSGSRTLNSIDKSCWMIRSAYNNDFN